MHLRLNRSLARMVTWSMRGSPLLRFATVILCLCPDSVWGQIDTPVTGTVSIEPSSGRALPVPVKKRADGARISLSGSGGGPLYVLDASGTVQEVLSSEETVLNEIRPDVIERERRQREERLQRGESLREQWLKKQADRRHEEELTRKAAEARTRLLDEGLKNRPTQKAPVNKNWITLNIYDRRFPAHLVDSTGNPVPIPDPNPRANIAQSRFAHPDPITPAGPTQRDGKPK